MCKAVNDNDNLRVVNDIINQTRRGKQARLSGQRVAAAVYCELC